MRKWVPWNHVLVFKLTFTWCNIFSSPFVYEIFNILLPSGLQIIDELTFVEIKVHETIEIKNPLLDGIQKTAVIVDKKLCVPVATKAE
jgi:hypothetical protein